ncbi:integrin beta-2-like [Megalops cyprinoides]|uniref:integrin beta-2-like n=1 Tax=Megalops cyprinoides TaxID=118141 RepID=UPI0018641142|nr:integrin beta-2-like [Megalops cyprinoides]
MYHWSFILQILLLTGRDVLSQEECPKGPIRSCGDCITSGPFCAWCKQLNFTKKGESIAVRCDTKAVLLERGCQETDVISPQSYHIPLRNDPFSKATSIHQEPVQLKPQEVKLVLRPGKAYTFQLQFKRAQDYPVDLYYLMDLSYSMKDDLENVKKLGKDLLKTLRTITSRARIGFGSFVDKTVLPFTNTNPDKLKKPCPENETSCEPAFGYRHVLSLTDDQNKFNNRVSAQKISGNLDVPEGGLDAIMQAAVCGDKIGWGNSTRLLVFTTDAGFHMAGDGRLAAILDPNDGECHLDSSDVYSKTNDMDYPSVSQVADKLAKNNIQPIFAVTKNTADVYMKLKELIPKSEVGVLSGDSSNVVGLIEKAYKSLSSNVIVTHSELPDHVRVTYTSDCPAGRRPDTRGICNDVSIGQTVTFTVTVTAQKCINEASFLIGPLSFREKMKVTVATHCQCSCDDSADTNSPHCSGKGKVTCGICNCAKGFVGQRCECQVGDKDEDHLRAACRLNNGTECSGLGDCICGVCHCHASEDGRNIYGTYCECDDRSCEVHQNKLCGGNGRCDCGKCVCNPDYEGSACQCKKSNEGCSVGGKSVCSGRGKCVCNVCQCEDGYTLPFCQTCPGCPSPCQKSASCIECLGFNSGPLSKSCSSACQHIKHTMVEKLKADKPCEVKDSNNCLMVFKMNELDGINNYEAFILDKRVCPEPPNVIAIVGGTLAAVALIGLLLLLLIKGLLYMKDLKEFRRFENEKQRAKWSNADNPLFKTATTTVQNPNFSGE